MEYKIGIFDSGIGGFTILDELKKILPNERYIYYKDTKNNPYGEKNEQELLEITKNIVKFLKTKGCKVIVIACNTATTKCMKQLRLLYPNLIIIGVVPAIKVACDNGYKNVLVMATVATIESERIKELIENNKKNDQNIYLLPCNGLAHAIEFNDINLIKKLLKTYFKPYKNKNIDSIVLGCTHYSLIKKEIHEEFPNVVLLDGSYGTAKEVKRKLEENKILSNNEKGDVQIIST